MTQLHLAVLAVTLFAVHHGACTVMGETIAQLGASSGTAAVCTPRERGTHCPLECKCSTRSSGTVVDCGRRKLERLPTRLPPDTQVLLLNNNKLTNLPADAFLGCVTLEKLDLSSNNISSVADKAFIGVDQLGTLLLNDNNIDFNQVSTTLFQNLTQLSELSINSNKLQVKGTYNDKLFEPLRNLRNLTMDGLANANFGSGFSGLHNLEYLNILGDFRYITNDTFRNLNQTTLKTFMVRSGVLTDVDVLAFSHFSHLETLDLSFNPVLGFPVVSKSWYGLQYTNISSLILERVAPADYRIITIDRSFFKHLELTKLKKLVLNNNDIVYILAVFSFHTHHLEYLSVAYNRLGPVLNFMVDMFFLPKLEYLDISYQSRHPESFDQFPREPPFTTMQSLSESHRSHQVTAALTPKQANRHLLGVLTNLTLLRDLHQYGGVYIEGAGYISGAISLTSDLYILLGPPSLRVFLCAASLQMAIDTFPKTTIIGMTHLQILDYSQNAMRRLIGPLIVVKPAQVKFSLDFSDNGCSYMDPNFGDQIGPFVGSLYFSRNALGPQAAVDNGTLLQYFNELEVLDASFNSIKSLRTNIFIHQTKMQHLNLSYNSLRLVEFRFDHMVDLVKLDLSGNLLYELDLSTREHLDVAASKRNLTVDLKDNPLKCSCDSLSFLEWIPQTPVHLSNWEQYECMYLDHTTNLSTLRSTILPKLQVDCHSKTWVIASACALVGIAVVIGASFALYRHRFEIRYLCLKLVVNRRRYENLVEEEVAHEYDAFVAFDQNNITWVNEELIPKMDSSDGEGEFKLLVHHRDFMPGMCIEENILRGIQKSRKVILVLSRHFVESNWCDFELQMARMRCFEEGKELVVPILLEEDVVRMNMSRTLRSLLNRNCYIKWPENPAEINNFWINLKKALAANPDKIITCQCGRTMNM